MGQYYDLIMEPTKGTFTHYFNECWNNQLNQLASPYANAIQLRIGNQLRPKLTCWGASLNTNSIEQIDLAHVAEVATYIEMLHKASIIIDDIIDDDEARHGKQTFHVEFGRDKAIIFALSLLGKGTAGINSIFRKSKKHFQSLELFSNTIYNMALGCLEELGIDSSSRYDIDKIRKIINLETISLIKNSFLLGYWSNNKLDSEAEPIIVEIGENCGYLFQILNDLEPFSSIKKNIAYKGGMNIDINRNRKNIVVAYIFGAASKKEKQSLLSLSGDELQSFIFELYIKYSVYDEVCNEARILEKKSEDLIKKLHQVSTYTGSLGDLKIFVNEMVNICFSKLN